MMISAHALAANVIDRVQPDDVTTRHDHQSLFDVVTDPIGSLPHVWL